MENKERRATPLPAYDTPVHIRWWIRRDMPETLAIDELANEWEAQSEEELLSKLRQRNVIGMVAEKGDKIVGFMIYELHKGHLFIDSFCVHPDWQRQDVGTQMIDKLKSKLSSHRRTHIQIIVKDTKLGTHLFLRSMGFKAIEVMRNHYEIDDADAYLFEYVLPEVQKQQRFRKND